MVIVIIAPAVPIISPVSGSRIVEHGCAFVCASRKLHIKGGTFDLAAHGDCFALVDLFAGVVADELDLED